MPVDVQFLNFGSPVPSSYTDDLSNSTGSITGPQNSATVNSFNWVYMILGWDSPFASGAKFVSSFALGSTLSAGGGTGMSTGIQDMGGTYNWFSGIVPSRMLPGLGKFTSPYYASKKKFVQFTFNANNGSVAGGVGIINFEDVTGNGIAGNSAICHDCYLLRCDGNFIRYNSGTAATVLQGSITFTQGDVWRLAMDASGASSTVLTLTKNGTTFATITDSTVNRLTGPGMPIIAAVPVGVSPVFEIKNFSCGVGL